MALVVFKACNSELGPQAYFESQGRLSKYAYDPYPDRGFKGLTQRAQYPSNMEYTSNIIRIHRIV